MVFRKTFLTYNIFGPTHSRYVPPVSRAPASELVLQRGGLPSEKAFTFFNIFTWNFQNRCRIEFRT